MPTQPPKHIGELVSGPFDGAMISIPEVNGGPAWGVIMRRDDRGALVLCEPEAPDAVVYHRERIREDGVHVMIHAPENLTVAHE